jgi:hypothetical protein
MAWTLPAPGMFACRKLEKFPGIPSHSWQKSSFSHMSTGQAIANTAGPGSPPPALPGPAAGAPAAARIGAEQVDIKISIYFDGL